MSKVECFYYLTESSKSPVREFIDSLDYKTQRKFFFVKALLEEFGHRLPQPHAKYIGDDIFELRFKGQEGAIFTNGFVKKTDKTPRNEKESAVQKRTEFLKRQGG